MSMSGSMYAAPLLLSAILVYAEWLVSHFGMSDAEPQAQTVPDPENSAMAALKEVGWIVAAMLSVAYISLHMQRRNKRHAAERRRLAKLARSKGDSAEAEAEENNEAVDMTHWPQMSSAPGNSAEARTNREFTSCLRTCLKTRAFKEGLASFDAIESSIGAGCKTVWSMLLYCAVEAKEFRRCSDFIRLLLEFGDLNGNDFVNIVRFGVNGRDAAGLVSILNATKRVAYEPDLISRNRALGVCLAAGEPKLAEALIEATKTVPLDVVAYNTLIRLYGQRGDLTRCNNLVAEMRAASFQPNDITFGILIDASIKCRDMDGAFQAFMEVRSSGLQPNVVHYTTLIKGLVFSQRLDAAESLFSEMLAGSAARPDAVTYAMLMKAYSEQGFIESAVRLLKQMLKQGIEPDCVMFNTALHACSAKDMEPKVILNTFASLVELGLQPNTATQSIMIKALVRSQGFSHALQFLNDFHVRFGREASPRVFEQLARACQAAEHNCEAKQIEGLALAQRDLAVRR